MFINYHEGDFPSAQRLYSDLSAASLKPWIDKENLLPGQIRDTEIEKGIKESRYFIALLSSRSINDIGDAQLQIKKGLSVKDRFPESKIYFIPARLDEFDSGSQTALLDIEYVDMFPVWEKGLERILNAMKFDDEFIGSVIEHQHTNSAFASLDTPPGKVQTQLFKVEKQFFVGRQDYINQTIKDKLKDPGSKVSIVGPGGSGKSQLAFKAMHEYVGKGIFDLVIPIYFGEGLLSFDKFLWQMAEIMGVKSVDFELNTTIEQRKDIIRGLLSKKKHPLIYLDNFETVSLILNNMTNLETKESIQNANQITYFLNNIAPSENTSILVSSREKKNNLSDEYPIDLEGLNLEDSMRLFNNFVRPIFKGQEGKTRDQIQSIMKKTGGHPLSIEIIAKNLRGLHELENISKNLGLRRDPTQPEERLQTLHACFDYTIKRLDDKLQELLPKLTLLKSPFPISAAVEIFDLSENEILDLYDRSLLNLVNSDEIYGKIHDPEYWLYDFYFPVRGHVEYMMLKNGPSLRSLETEYGKKFSNFYYNLLLDTYDSVGKETHRSSLARFSIILQSDENDLLRAVKLATDRQQSAHILSYLGLMTSRLGMFSKALEYHKEALEINAELNDKVGMARDYSSIGIVLRDMGNYQQALDYNKNALEIHTELNDKVGIGRDYGDIGIVHYKMGNYQQALDYLNSALEIRTELNERVGMAKDYGEIGLVLSEMGNYQQALDHHNKALEINEDLNNRVEMAKDYNNIGTVLSMIGNYQQALDHNKNALEIHTELNDTVGMAADYNNIGIVLSNMGNSPDALTYHKKALEIDENLNDRVGMARAYTNIGSVQYRLNNFDGALDYYTKALGINESLNDRVEMAKDYWGIGQALKKLNKRKKAVESVQSGLNILLELEGEMGYHHPLIETLKQIRKSI